MVDPKSDIRIPAQVIYECELAHELTHFGLQHLTGNWLDLEVGTYTVALERSATLETTYQQTANPPYLSLTPEPHPYRILILE